MATTTPEQIRDIVWRACDTFRGAIDPTQYKDYILVMLFLKYLSDLKKDEVAQLEKRYDGDVTRIARALARSRFVIPEGADFDTLHAARKNPNADLGNLINMALTAIEDANKRKLDGVFRNIDFASEGNLGERTERNARLKHLLEDFADPRLDLRPSQVGGRDVIGDAYEYLIGQFAADAGKKGGEFYTPKEVSDLLAQLVEPAAGDRICDPCCGSGSLLIKAGRAIGNDDFALYGMEMNASTWALCRINLFLHEMDTTRVERCDTIRNTKLVEADRLMRFQVVLANPPFSLDKWGADFAEHDPWARFHRGIPPKNRGDWAFVSHMLEVMTAADGRVGVVVPHGVLFRGGTEGRIRRRVIEENLLDGVVGLPENLFFGTGIPAALLLFRRQRKDDSVFFIDASRDFEPGKRQNRLRQADQQRILETWRARKDVDKYARRVELEEVATNDFRLNIPLYVATVESEAYVDLAALEREIEGIDMELGQVRLELKIALRSIGL